MFRIVFFIFIIVLLLTGALFFINVNIDENTYDSTESYMLDMLRRSDLAVYNTALHLTESCASKECAVNAIAKSMSGFKSTPYKNLSFSRMIAEKEASPEEMAVLMAALLESAGVENKIIGAKDGLYVLACGIDPDILYETANYSREGVLYQDKVKLAAGQIWFKKIDYEGDIIFNVISTSPVNTFIAGREGLSAVTDRKCAAVYKHDSTISCNITSSDFLYIQAPDKDVMFQVTVYKSILPNDIHMIYYKDNLCVPLYADNPGWGVNFDGKIIYTIN